MAVSTIELILHALTRIHAQIIAYHQMRTQAVVFISGLAVAVGGLTLTHRGEAGWAWVALLGPSAFLMIALFLAVYFRKLLDCCRAIEAELHEELQKAADAPALSTPPSQITLAPDSAVHYHIALKNETDIRGNKIPLKLWHDAPQKALIIYTLAYLIFWLFWFKPWK